MLLLFLLSNILYLWIPFLYKAFFNDFIICLQVYTNVSLRILNILPWLTPKPDSSYKLCRPKVTGTYFWGGGKMDLYNWSPWTQNSNCGWRQHSYFTVLIWIVCTLFLYTQNPKMSCLLASFFLAVSQWQGQWQIQQELTVFALFFLQCVL